MATGFCMDDRTIICSSRRLDDVTGTEATALAVASLLIPAHEVAGQVEEAVGSLKDARRFTGRMTWNRVATPKLPCYEAFLDILDAHDCEVSCMVWDMEGLPRAGGCLDIYEAIVESFLEWLRPETRGTVLLDGDFESRPCEGIGCRYAYVGGTSCPASSGKTPAASALHLRVHDIATIMDRHISPRANYTMELRGRRGARTDRGFLDAGWIEDVLDVAFGAAGYSRSGKTGNVAKETLCMRLGVRMDTAPGQERDRGLDSRGASDMMVTTTDDGVGCEDGSAGDQLWDPKTGPELHGI